MATAGEEQIDLAWSASTDAENAVSYRYRAWLTSGGATGEWATTTSTTATIADLVAGAYTAEVYAYSAGGASATDTATATVTMPLTTLLTDTFSRTAGPLINNPVADTGQSWQNNLYGGTITGDGKLAATGITWIDPGAPASELTVDFWTTIDPMRLSMSHDGTDMGEPLQQIVLTMSGVVSAPAISGVTFNISGGTNHYTAAGMFTTGTTHALRVTRDGNVVAVYLNGVKMLEGTAAARPGNYVALVGAGGATENTFDNLVVKG